MSLAGPLGWAQDTTIYTMWMVDGWYRIRYPPH